MPDFSYALRRNGDVEIRRDGRVVTILRGDAAADFTAAVHSPGCDEQQLMARVTGNYKRGNERLAKGHPRNR